VRPVLSDGYAGNLLARGETDGVESRLLDAERGLSLDARDIPAAREWTPPILIADEAAFPKLPASIAIHRAGQAQLLGDIAGTIEHASRALELIDKDDVIGWASASALLLAAPPRPTDAPGERAGGEGSAACSVA
jgi:LuxR family maltose regulon positive regulatory protein